MQQRSVVCAASSCEIKRRVTKAISHTAASPLRVDLQFTYLLTYLLRFRYRPARLRAVGLRHVTIL